MPTRTMLVAAIVVLALIACLCIYHLGGEAPREELEAAHDQIEALTDVAETVADSNEISRQTAARVDVTGAETRQRATQARERIIERVEADPVPAGDVDPVVLHEAGEAYAAAVRAACRVQRTDDCPAPAAAAD